MAAKQDSMLKELIDGLQEDCPGNIRRLSPTRFTATC